MINFNNGTTCTKIGLIVNLLLTITKFLIGMLSKSQAMIADSLHSLSDEIATIMVYFSIKVSDKPADKNHPYGHGNIEVLVALFVSLLILLTGIFLGYSAIHSIIHKHFSVPGKIALYGAVLSIIIKEILYRYTISVGKKLNSPAIIANAYDHRTDVFSSVGALIAISVARMGYPYLDPIGGIVISIFIVKMGIDIIRDNVNIVMNTVPNEKIHLDIERITLTTAGVKKIISSKIHIVGRHYYLDLTVSVDKDITVEKGHNIAETIKGNIIKEKREIKDVIVHIEPHYEMEEYTGWHKLLMV